MRYVVLMAMSAALIVAGAAPCVWVAATSGRSSARSRVEVQRNIADIDYAAVAPAPIFLILKRNGTIALMCIAGALTGGIFTVFFLLKASFVSVEPLCRAGGFPNIPWWLSMAALLPHLPLELVGFCCAGAAGFSGFVILLDLGRASVDRMRSVHLFTRLSGTSLLLLVTAAIVESYVTPAVIRFVIRALNR